MVSFRIFRFAEIGRAGALLGVLLGVLSCGFSEDDLRCQRAGARLVECCHGYAIETVNCGQLAGENSRCILASSCAALTEGGFCDDVARLDDLAGELCPR